MSQTLYIKSGSIRVPIFRSSTHLKGKRYSSYVIRWRDLSGLSRVLKRAKLSVAKAEAQRIADDLASGRPQCTLSNAEVASYIAASNHLRYSSKPIELVAGEYAEAMAIAPDVALPELARFWVAHRPKAVIDLATADLVEKFLLTKREQGVSERWIGTLSSQLGRFANDISGRASELTADRVQAWYLRLCDIKRDGTPGPLLKPVSRNNYLAAVQNLFSLPALRSHPERQAILDLQPIKEGEAENKIWKPAEFRNLLETALLPYRVHSKRTRREEVRSHAHLIPVLVLGGFCKLRSSEIMRVEWDRLDLDHSRLILRKGQTKTERWRVVPLPDCAVAWLRVIGVKTGKVWLWGDSKFSKDLRGLARRCELKWRENALRNSACTFDEMLNPDTARVAREAGNSPAVLESNYLAVQNITRADAEAWFAILPPKSGSKIVPISCPK